MANVPFGHFSGDFESLARQYWNTWNELLGRGSTFDAWGLAGGMPPGLGGMDPVSYDWYQRMQRLAADFSGGGAAPDIARAWRDMLGMQGGDAFGAMLRSMPGGLAGGGAWMEQVRPLLDMLLRPLRQQGTEWLQRPAFGPAREHQERLQALALAFQEWERHNEAFGAVLARALEAAHERFGRLLAEHDAPGKRLESARALFDLWIDAAEEAWAEIALSDEYRHVYAQMTNSLMRLRLGLQREVEQFGALLGLPGRNEVDALHRKVADLERSLHAVRRGKVDVDARAAGAAIRRRGAAAPVETAPVEAPVAEPTGPVTGGRTRRAAGGKVGASRAGARKPVPAKPGKAVARPDMARSRGPTAAVTAAAAKPAPSRPGAKKTAGALPVPQAAKKAARPAKARKPVPRAAAARTAVPTRTRSATAAAGADRPATKPAPKTAAKSGARGSAAKPAPAAGTAATRNAARASRPAPVRGPAAAKVVSMKDWVSRHLADGNEPAGKGKAGRRGGRER